MGWTGYWAQKPIWNFIGALFVVGLPVIGFGPTEVTFAILTALGFLNLLLFHALGAIGTSIDNSTRATRELAEEVRALNRRLAAKDEDRRA